MINKEEQLWGQLTKRRKIVSNDSAWLASIYSTNLSKRLRFTIAERLGWQGSKGWKYLKKLIDEKGIQKELIYAAGLCYQVEAKDWLFTQLQIRSDYKLELLKALACWGADFPLELLQETLKDKSANIRLAGLDLLNFKAYKLNDQTILKVLEEPLKDPRDPVVLGAIDILKKRNGSKICKELTQLIIFGSKEISKAGLIALGSMANANSQKALLKLSQTLSGGAQKEMAIKQLRNICI